jgi:DNA-binding LacI/PurR family transcriptional regulator
MSSKRVTIYDLAKELGISASYISRALNDHPSISEKVKETVKKKAIELNYKHNSQAANLRQGSSKIIGVIVPHINQSFFSEAIAGMEEACFENNHSLIICQSHESFAHECKAIDTLIHQNVDCILISISAETQSSAHLETVIENNIELIQFDRCIDQLDSYKVLNDNEETSYKVVKDLIKAGYKKIAYVGGPAHLTLFKNRKEGYIKAIKEARLVIPYNYIVEDALSKERAMEAATELLTFPEPPDAFFTVSDHQSLGILQVADSLGIKMPEQLGIFGFANEYFTEITKPALSSVDQKSKELGKCAANLYFEKILKGKGEVCTNKKEIIKSEIIIRQSSLRTPSH